MEDDLIFLKMEDDLKILKTEDNLKKNMQSKITKSEQIIIENGDDLNIISEKEDDINFL
jgi:hypothetical protein